MSWLDKVKTSRGAPQGAAQPARAEKPAGRAQLPAADVEALAPAGLSAKVLDALGANLKGSIPELTAIAQTSERMEPHRAAQFGRAIDAFYQRLGKDLAQVPADQRTAAVETSVRALRELTEGIAHDEMMGAAISAMSDLVRYTAASKGAFDGDAAARTAAAAKDAVLSLVQALEGRAGSASALNIYPNIVWQVENTAPREGAERFARWGEIAQLVADSLPRGRIDQVDVARLGAAVAAELEKKQGDVRAALGRAKQLIHAETAPAFAPARVQLGVVPPMVAAGTPNAEAWDLMSKVLGRVLDANPAGPGSLGAAIEALAGRTSELVVRAGAEHLPAWRAIAAIIEGSAASPAAEPIARFLADHLPALIDAPAARAELERGKAEDAAATVVRAYATALGQNAAGFEGALQRFDGMTIVLQMQAALAAMPHLGNGGVGAALVDALARFSSTAPAAGQEALAGFAGRFSAVYPQLLGALGEPRASEVASAIARANLNAPLSAEQARAVADTCSRVAAALPDAPLASLIADDAERRAGLITLSNAAAYRFDPRNYLTALVQPIAQAAAADRVELLRHAMHLAGELGKLDRDPGVMFRKVQQDWQSALMHPENLRFGERAGGRVAVRARGAKENDHAAAAFLRQHRELPAELAITAAVNFSPEQVTWLLGQVTSTRSRAMVRNIRDAMFAAMEAGRADVIEAMRQSNSPPAAITGTMTFVAAEYRGGRAAQIPWNVILEGLRAGGDPAANIEKERAQAALAQLNLQELNAGKADPAGLARLAKVQADVRGILQVLPVNGQAYGAPSARLRDPFIAALRATADGTWPKVKYEGEVPKRILAKLTPHQREVWMQEGVTPMNAQPAQAAGPELQEAFTILKGIGPALKKEAKLAAEGLALNFDAASRDLARAELEKLNGEIHNVEKGSPEHRALSRKLGPLASSLAVIELVLALDALRAKGAVDPATAINELKGQLLAAQAAARRLGARGSAEAMTRVLEAAPEVRSSPRTGIYASDEDNVDAYVTAFDGGCMRAQGGGNQGGQVEFITSPQYKMVRTCNGEVGLTRSVLRLLDVEMPNYKGPALWLDGPYTTARGGNPTAEHYKLAYKHALNKAKAMGVPFMYGPIGYGGGKDQGAPAMREAGAAPVQANVKVTFDRGTTGLHHCQSLLGDQHYWVPWGYNVGYPLAPDAVQTYSGNINASVVMP